MDAIEKILNLDVPQDVQLSRDAAQVVYSTSLPFGHKNDENAVGKLWLAQTDQEHSARQITSGLFNDKSPRWSPDNISIAFVSDRAKAGKSSALYQLSLKGGEPVALTPVENERPIGRHEYSPDGKFIAFLSADEKTSEKKAKEEAKDDAQVYGEDRAYNRLRLLHVSSKAVSTIVTKEAHVVDFAWSPDGSDIAFVTTKTTDMESTFVEGAKIERVSTTTKDISHLADCPYGFAPWAAMHWVNGDLFVVANADSKTILGSQVVWIVSTKDGEWFPIAGGKADCATAVCPNGEDDAFIKVSAGLSDQIRTLDGSLFYKDVTGISGWHGMLGSGDQMMHLALIKSTINKPSEVFTLNELERQPVQLSAHGQEFKDDIANAQEISIKSDDNQEDIDAILFLPKRGNASQPFATFVGPHGGPYARVTNEFLPQLGWAQSILRSGHAVLFTNYRGGSSHGSKFAKYLTPGVGTVDYEDVITLTNHCVEAGFSDPKKLIIGGWSQGGFLTYLSAVRNGTHEHGWRFRAGIAGAGITDWDTMAMTSDLPGFQAAFTGFAPWDAEKKDTNGRTGSPLWEFAEAAKAKRIPPMLLLHGAEDIRVPITQAWGFQRGCKKFGLPCELVTYPREPHVFTERKHILDMFKRVTQFCDLHLS